MNFKMHVDISGLGNSGKSVVSDYLSEFDGVFVPRKDFEFNLLRAPGGLMDLKRSLVDYWTPIRSDDAIRRFGKLLRRLGTGINLSKPTEIIHAAGFNYESFFPGFKDLTNTFLNDLVCFEYKGVWPYLFYHCSGYHLIMDRLLSKIKGKTVLNDIYFVHDADVTEKLSSLMYQILNLGLNGKTYHTTITHNSFEPFEINDYLDLFPYSKSILVVRDPRDIYVNIVKGNNSAIPFFRKINPSYYNISAANDIDKYILYQKKTMSCLSKLNQKNILVINFDEFVTNYEEVSKNVNDFLDLNEGMHINKFKNFNPEVSKNNLGLYKKHNNQSNINKIETELDSYWNFT
jgi:hypothetical protein